MTDTPTAPVRGLIEEPDPEALVEEVIETSLHPDRAHHDELGRTRGLDEDGEPGPREQPAAPIDVAHIDE